MAESLRAKTARSVLASLPFVMRAVGQGMRSSGGDMSPVQHRLLMQIAHRPRTLSEVAELQGVTPATVTSLITTLENREWAHRRRETEDRRKVIVSVTPRGLEALATAQESAELAVAEMLEVLDADELEQVRAGADLLKRAGSSECLPHASSDMKGVRNS